MPGWPSGVDLACLHGDASDWSNRTLIVPAVFREWRNHQPPPWLVSQYPVYLYQRTNASANCFCANRGYESAVYLHFIAQHYTRLPAYVAFVQADWTFSTKTNLGKPFQFWQPRCMQQRVLLPWSDYMPLGGRRSVWPPRCVSRQLSWYHKVVGKRHVAVVEACVRELLRLVGWPDGSVRPYNRTMPLNVTFYTNMNFLASRARLRRYSHQTYRTLADRFVVQGVCVPPPARASNSSGHGHGGSSSHFRHTSLLSSNHSSLHNWSVHDGSLGGESLSFPPAPPNGLTSPEAILAYWGIKDHAGFAKATLGMATELLQQALFADKPVLEDAPPPNVPLDGDHCEAPAVTKCSIGS